VRRRPHAARARTTRRQASCRFHPPSGCRWRARGTPPFALQVPTIESRVARGHHGAEHGGEWREREAHCAPAARARPDPLDHTHAAGTRGVVLLRIAQHATGVQRATSLGSAAPWRLPRESSAPRPRAPTRPQCQAVRRTTPSPARTASESRTRPRSASATPATPPPRAVPARHPCAAQSAVARAPPTGSGRVVHRA
jgi:hypothetical protein